MSKQWMEATITFELGDISIREIAVYEVGREEKDLIRLARDRIKEVVAAKRGRLVAQLVPSGAKLMKEIVNQFNSYYGGLYTEWRTLQGDTTPEERARAKQIVDLFRVCFPSVGTIVSFKDDPEPENWMQFRAWAESRQFIRFRKLEQAP